MSIQFIHCSDLHLDRNFANLGIQRSQQRKLDLNRNFSSIIDYAIHNKPDLFLISGDVFDKYLPSNSAQVYFISEIKKLYEAGIQTCIIGGNHDVPRLGQKPVLSINILSTIGLATVFSDSSNFQTKSIKIDDKEILIIGKSYYSQTDNHNPLANLPRVNKGTYNILMIHGSLIGYEMSSDSISAYNPFSLNDINKEINYVALGHNHKYFLFDSHDTKICNPGSIEKLTWSEKNDDKGFIWGEIENSQTTSKFIPLKCRDRLEKDVFLSNEDNDIHEKVKKVVISLLNVERLLKLNLYGKITFDQFNSMKVSELLFLYRDAFFQIEIDRQKLEVQEFGKVFFAKNENPISAFATRLDKQLMRTNDDSHRMALESIKTLGLKYLEDANN